MSRILSLIICSTIGCSESGIMRLDATSDTSADRLIVGTTTVDGRGFYPLQGDQVLIAGAQGGFHVWLKVRITGLPPGDMKLRRIARRAADARVLLDAQSIVQIGVATGGYWEQPSPVPLFVCPTPIGVTIVDQAVQGDITLLDSTAGVEGNASITFTAHCPDDTRAACLALCSG